MLQTIENGASVPNDEEEVNTREIHKCDGQAHDPDTMVVPLTPKPTRKAEALARAADHCLTSRRRRCAEGSDIATVSLRERHSRTKDGSTAAKAPAPRTNPNIVICSICKKKKSNVRLRNQIIRTLPES
jgi:hypothetical protein